MSDDGKTGMEDDDRFQGEKGGSDREKRSSSPPKRARTHRDGIKHIFVGPTGRRTGNDIEYYANEPELKEKFNQFGKVTDVKVRSNAKDVFAFVTFETSEDAGRAIAGMNGKALKGVKVKCDWGAYNGDRAVRRPPPFRRSPPRYRSSRYDRDYDRHRYERSYRRRSPSPRYSRYRRSPSPRYRRRSPSPRYSRRYSRSPRRESSRYDRRSRERHRSPERRRSPSRERSQSPRRSRS